MAEATNALKVTVRRTIDASPEELYDAWLEPDSLALWMRPRAVQHATAQVEARVGGAFEVVMHTSEGPLRHSGAYRTLERPRKLVFTWISAATGGRESVVTVELLPHGQRTEVVVTHHQLPDAPAQDSHTEGWSDALALLAQHFSH